jgi:hypothetical protein
VDELIELVEHRAQINNDRTNFDYTDEPSELQYAIAKGDSEKIDDLKEYILSDLRNIESVLQANIFKNIRLKLIQVWFTNADEDQYQTLKAYFENKCQDENLKKMWKSLHSSPEN